MGFIMGDQDLIDQSRRAAAKRERERQQEEETQAAQEGDE